MVEDSEKIGLLQSFGGRKEYCKAFLCFLLLRKMEVKGH
jgi:hypothetical protein